MTMFLEELFSNYYTNAWGTQYTRENSKCSFFAYTRNNGLLEKYILKRSLRCKEQIILSGLLINAFDFSER